MMETTELKQTKFLALFYKNIAKEDWLEGLNLYKDDRVQNLQTFTNLITADVHSAHAVAQVRIKIHPQGHVVQWIECTCKKNHTYGSYCEHIGAVIIFIDREKATLFRKLDLKMPIKAPLPKKPRRSEAARLFGATEKSEESSHRSIVDHLSETIRRVTFKSKGANIRLHLEIKPGHQSLLDLDVDESARFLRDNPKHGQGLKLFSNQAEVGTYIFLKDDEKVVAERVICLKIPSKSMLRRITGIRSYQSKCIRRDHETEGKRQPYLLVPYKSGARYLGKEYFFLPGLGFYPLLTGQAKSTWFELPFQKAFVDDAAAEFVIRNFKEYTELAPCWIDEKLGQQRVHHPKLRSVDIVGEDDGWFKIASIYEQADVQVSMSDMLKQYLATKRHYIRNKNAWFRIPSFVTEHDWKFNKTSNTLQAGALDVLRFKAHLNDNLARFTGEKELLEAVKHKIKFDPNIVTPELTHTNLNLRNYQVEGLKWLWWLYRNGLHGLLADDMGLGKTHQAMAVMSAIQTEKKNARFLVICPTTVIDHWDDKLTTFAPNLRAIKYHGPNRTYSPERLEQFCTVVTSYGILLREIKALEEIEWDAIILDEAHYVKNNNTSTYKAACRLRSHFRLCLTGTPLENHLGELKNLFDFLVPGYLGTDRYFRENYLTPVEQNQDAHQELILKRLIAPLKLRRRKSEVLSDLPDKIEDVRRCGMSAEQIRLYREIVTMRSRPLIDLLKDRSEPIPYLHVFTILQLLKQVCDHPALIMAGTDYRNHVSEKFELLKEIINESLDSGNKIVIFSQYIGMINIIKQYCADQKIGHVSLTGKTRNRGKVIKSFQEDPNMSIFVGSLMAGGIGIDLTAASVVIHYDRWWNASKENQATDRVHRIGQKKYVQVLKLVTRDTLEEKIDRMISQKSSLFSRFLEKDEELFKAMSRDEIIELLQ